jgi:hypothetical protein
VYRLEADGPTFIFCADHAIGSIAIVIGIFGHSIGSDRSQNKKLRSVVVLQSHIGRIAKATPSVL